MQNSSKGGVCENAQMLMLSWRTNCEITTKHGTIITMGVLCPRKAKLCELKKMTIEDMMSVPLDFKKCFNNDVLEEHRNVNGIAIITRKDENNRIYQRWRFNKHGNGWGFFRDSQNIIWFYLIEDDISLFEEEIAICRSSEKSEKR